MNNRLAEHFVHTKDIFIVPLDDVPFVVQTIACGFQTLVRNDVRDEIGHIDYLPKVKDSLWIVTVIDREVAFAVSLYIEHSVSCEKRFRFARPKRSG